MVSASSVVPSACFYFHSAKADGMDSQVIVPIDSLTKDEAPTATSQALQTLTRTSQNSKVKTIIDSYNCGQIVPVNKETEVAPPTDRSGAVSQALDLLMDDSDVRSAVVSLAQDTNIWQAIHQNEGVRSCLARRRQRSLIPDFEESKSEFPVPSTVLSLPFKTTSHTAPRCGAIITAISKLNSVFKAIGGFAKKLFT